MKKTYWRIIGLVLCMAAPLMLAFPYTPFTDWGDVTKHSPSIIIARCIKPAVRDQVTNGYVIVKGSVGESEIELVSVLKGTNTLPGTKAALSSERWPHQGESYLIFAAYYDGTTCQAIEEYRVVPLGSYFETNMVTGRTLDEQIKSLLQLRLGVLNWQAKQMETEKQRLEEFLKK
jgi:hypothetical protein